METSAFLLCPGHEFERFSPRSVICKCIFSGNTVSSQIHMGTISSYSWWSLGLEDDIICASYLWVREWLCRPILDLQSRAQSGHWKFAFVAGIEAAKWRRSLADCAWWRRSSSSVARGQSHSLGHGCWVPVVRQSITTGEHLRLHVWVLH